MDPTQRSLNMTSTRTPPTANDIAGTTTRGRAAYNQRRRDLASKGIHIADRHDDDAQPGDEELRRTDPEAYRHMMADRAEVASLERDLNAADVDDETWMWPGGQRPH
jgi:hypothetical protein